MSFWEIFLLALALAMDALAVSIGLGLSAKGSLARCAAWQGQRRGPDCAAWRGQRRGPDCAAWRGQRRGPDCAARAAAAFGLFQSGMTLAGWLGGRALSGWVGAAGSAVADGVAAGILAVVGAHMLVEAARRRPEPSPAEGGGASGGGRLSGWTLVGLAVATSLDAFGAGLGLAMVGADVWIAALVIGLVAAALSALGVMLAGRLARRASARIPRAAGALVLLALAAKIAIGTGS